MIHCRINEILKSKNKTPLWLSQELNCNIEIINDLIENKNAIIHFEILEKLCDILECTPNDIFVIINEQI